MIILYVFVQYLCHTGSHKVTHQGPRFDCCVSCLLGELVTDLGASETLVVVEGLTSDPFI